MDNRSFSPKARWDRNIPLDSDQAQPESLDEVIDCTALFKNGKIYPLEFVLKNRNYCIKKVNYAWQERQGAARISLFSVSTGTENYQLSFNNSTFGWRLDKVIS